MSNIFDIDLTKPLDKSFIEMLSDNKESYKLSFQSLLETEKNQLHSRVDFDSYLQNSEESGSTLFKGGKSLESSEKEASGVIDILTSNLIALGNSIREVEQLDSLSLYCEEVIKKHKLTVKQRCTVFAAFANIVYNLDEVCCSELTDRIKADIKVDTVDSIDDFIKLVTLFSSTEGEVYTFYKDFVNDEMAFREYFKKKRDTINRVYNALMEAGD